MPAGLINQTPTKNENRVGFIRPELQWETRASNPALWLHQQPVLPFISLSWYNIQWRLYQGEMAEWTNPTRNSSLNSSAGLFSDSCEESVTFLSQNRPPRKRLCPYGYRRLKFSASLNFSGAKSGIATRKRSGKQFQRMTDPSCSGKRGRRTLLSGCTSNQSCLLFPYLGIIYSGGYIKERWLSGR